MYKVDLDKFLTDRLNLSGVALLNRDVLDLIEIVREEMGEDLYTKDKNGNTFSNLDGKSVNISASYGRWISVRLYGSGNPLLYDVYVRKDGKTESKSRSREESLSKFSKYFVIYDGDKESIRSICFRGQGYLSISLHSSRAISSPYISFDTDRAEATVKLNNEDYDVLHEIMLSYSDSDNLYEFLSDNADLLNKYLDLIKEENAEYYEYLCDLINGYIEKAKTLRYE